MSSSSSSDQVVNGSAAGGSGGNSLLAKGSSRYDKIRMLGSGTFGQAWLVKSNQSGRLYVIKEMQMTQGITSNERDKTFNEVNIIRSCSHVNIIRYKEFFITQSPLNVSILSIAMEYADAGDLNECLKRYKDELKTFVKENQIRNWLVQLTFALQYLHKKSILHRDLKTQNIFMTKSKLLKLGDFGISRTLSHENDFATTGIGTPQYLSPEICRQQKYDYKCDIWGLGCVLYEMCALEPAFPGPDFPSLYQNIIRGIYKPVPNHFSNNLCELVKVMLRPNPSRRPSAEQILGAKVLAQDVTSYMSLIQSLPDALNDLHGQRKGSSGSVSSADGNGSCGAKNPSSLSSSGELNTLV